MKRAFTSLSCCCFHHPGASIPHRGSLLRRGSHWMFQWSSTSTQSSRSLEQEGTDKYLEVSEGDRVQHSLKEKIRKEYYPRIRMVLKSELNFPNQTGSACTATRRGWGKQLLCPQNKGQGQNTGVAHSSGPNGYQKRSTANTHNG